MNDVIYTHLVDVTYVGFCFISNPEGSCPQPVEDPNTTCITMCLPI